MIKCLGKIGNTDMCKKTIVVDTRFCKNHQYMNDYTDEMLADTILCTGCKKHFYSANKTKCCNKCKERTMKCRAEKQKDVVVIKCEKDSCKYKRSIENKYCNLHQRCLFEDEVKAQNKKCCANITRGCRAVLDLNYNYSSCSECLEKSRIKDRTRHQTKVVNNVGNVCVKCQKQCDESEFIDSRNNKTKNCLSCRKKQRILDKKRDEEHVRELSRINSMKPERQETKKEWRENNWEKCVEYWTKYRSKKINEVGIENYLELNAENHKKWLDNNKDKHEELYDNKKKSKGNRFKYYERCAIQKGINFDLSKDECCNLFDKSCYYCKHKDDNGFLNGIDRKSSYLGYIKDNVVTCCKMCNYIKGSLGHNDFLQIVDHILVYNQKIDGNLDYDIIPNRFACSYNKYKYSAVVRSKEFTLSKDEYHVLVNGNCYICGIGTFDDHINGIDRYDNTIGYIKDNCKTCCSTCNYLKRDYTYDDFINKLVEINENKIPLYYNNGESNMSDAKKQEHKENRMKNKQSKEERKTIETNRKDLAKQTLVDKYNDPQWIKSHAIEVAEKRTIKN